MKHNKALHPPFIKRIFAVWFRHYRVYVRHLVSNGLPPFLEPLIMIAVFGLGFGNYIQEMGGVEFIKFLGSGILITSAMYTAAFELTYGTYIRLEFDKVYDGMLGTPVTASDLLIGELFWAGTKGFFFTFAVLVVVSAFQVIPIGWSLVTPVFGFLTGLAFGALSFLVTSLVTSINHFNFYFTGLLTPMFFFSGVFFPISDLPEYLQWVGEALPLTHSVRLTRAFCFSNFEISLLWDLLYLILFIAIFGVIGVRRLRHKLVD